MQQPYEYYVVNPTTWKDLRQINYVKSCTISRDKEAQTLGSATFDIVESVGECYIRAYLITIQNGVREKHPLGTFLVQTPSYNYNGRMKSVTMDAYTPLLELKENPPPLGYSVLKGENIMTTAYNIVRENVRAPVVEAKCDTDLFADFVAELEDTWLTFTTDFIANARYEFDIDEMGRILFSPQQDTASLQPVWTFNDDNSSILHSDVTMDHDLYGIPNVVEVVYSNGDEFYYSKVVNDDENSPISTINRGREITYRESNPSVIGDPTGDQIDEYARRLLRDLSTLEYSITYKHGYCPVKVGDCVRLNYSRAGLNDIKAKVVSQSIECRPGCTVTEKAVFTTRLWG
jgi:hypothetical protein